MRLRRRLRREGRVRILASFSFGAQPASGVRARLRAGLVLACVGLGACAPSTPECAVPERVGALPEALREASGLAASRRHEGVLWTHDDSGGEPEIFAIDTAGRLLSTVRVTDATFTDWEDIEVGPCDVGDCIYIGDIGNNRRDRDSATIFVIPEPAPTETVSAPARRLRLRYPGGPAADAEALFVLPGPAVYVISKGIEQPVTVFRYPGEPRPGVAVELEAVQTLTPEPVALPDQVTGAGASPDGDLVAVRTYTALQLYRPTDGRLSAALLDSAGIDLTPAAEPQGEGVALGDGGNVWLVSERGLDTIAPLSRLRCSGG
ncbi:MAG: hypothetical protein ACRELV_06570 [Longimicrobiales bacterium]